jgi:prevent-host-death family protein
MRFMAKTIALREANEAFSRYIREVEAGEEITITRDDGQPVSRLVPVRRERILAPEQLAAVERTQRRMEKGWPLNIGRINREELYDEIVGRHDAKRRR